jgi:hypothetical protein
MCDEKMDEKPWIDPLEMEELNAMTECAIYLHLTNLSFLSSLGDAFAHFLFHVIFDKWEHLASTTTP